MDLVDGFDALPEDVQEKVERALEQGHVDDEDWNGVRATCPCYLVTANRAQDIECNRYDPTKRNQGMFIKKKTPKKKAEVSMSLTSMLGQTLTLLG